jgi:hypothetical protein
VRPLPKPAEIEKPPTSWTVDGARGGGAPKE